jgi:hypothetical protein
MAKGNLSVSPTPSRRSKRKQATKPIVSDDELFDEEIIDEESTESATNQQTLVNKGKDEEGGGEEGGRGGGDGGEKGGRGGGKGRVTGKRKGKKIGENPPKNQTRRKTALPASTTINKTATKKKKASPRKKTALPASNSNQPPKKTTPPPRKQTQKTEDYYSVPYHQTNSQYSLPWIVDPVCSLKITLLPNKEEKKIQSITFFGHQVPFVQGVQFHTKFRIERHMEDKDPTPTTFEVGDYCLLDPDYFAASSFKSSQSDPVVLREATEAVEYMKVKGPIVGEVMGMVYKLSRGYGVLFKLFLSVSSSNPKILKSYPFLIVVMNVKVRKGFTGILRKVEVLVDRVPVALDPFFFTVDGSSISHPFFPTCDDITSSFLYTSPQWKKSRCEIFGVLPRPNLKRKVYEVAGLTVEDESSKKQKLDHNATDEIAEWNQYMKDREKASDLDKQFCGALQESMVGFVWGLQRELAYADKINEEIHEELLKTKKDLLKALMALKSLREKNDNL